MTALSPKAANFSLWASFVARPRRDGNARQPAFPGGSGLLPRRSSRGDSGGLPPAGGRSATEGLSATARRRHGQRRLRNRRSLQSRQSIRNRRFRRQPVSCVPVAASQAWALVVSQAWRLAASSPRPGLPDTRPAAAISASLCVPQVVSKPPVWPSVVSPRGPLAASRPPASSSSAERPTLLPSYHDRIACHRREAPNHRHRHRSTSRRPTPPAVRRPVWIALSTCGDACVCGEPTLRPQGERRGGVLGSSSVG